MNVSMSPQLAEFVHEQVKSGVYGSASDVVRAGLRLLKEHEQDREARLERLRAEVAIGIEQLDQGEGIPSEEVFQELRQRNRELREKAE